MIKNKNKIRLEKKGWWETTKEKSLKIHVIQQITHYFEEKLLKSLYFSGEETKEEKNKKRTEQKCG